VTASAYREEQPPPELAPIVACLWERVAREDYTLRIVPDGCLDLIWMRDELIFAGPDTAAREIPLPRGSRSFGVRLRPGAAGAVLGRPASELRDQQVPVGEIWGAAGARIEEALAGAAPHAVLADAIRRRQAQPDELVRAAARLLAEPGARIGAVAAELGVSERHLHRRTIAAVGYSPKMLARVARLRRLAALEEESLARLALDAGYASQSHMADEVRRLTGLTPVRFLEDAPIAAA
jgi:AraC-like DNA-binding protein